MADSVILYNNDIIPLSMISDKEIFDPTDQNLLFFANGRVRRFFKNNKAYIAIFDSKSHAFIGYYDENNFWDFNKRNLTNNSTSTLIESLGEKFDFTYPLLYKPENYSVIVAYKDLAINQLSTENYEVKLFNFYNRIPYSIVKPIVNDVDLYNPDGYDVIPLEVVLNDVFALYYKFIVRKKYLGSTGELRNLLDSETQELLDVMQVLDIIMSDTTLKNFLQSKKVFEPFEAHLDLFIRYNSIPYGEIDQKYHNIYNEEYFARFRLKLIEFRYWLLRYKQDYSRIDLNDLAVYIVNIFPVEELSYLSYDFKVSLLDSLIYDNVWIKGGYSINAGQYSFSLLSEEQAIIKIVRSIGKEINGTPNYIEIDNFLDKLNGVLYHKNLSAAEVISYYQIIYDRIDDQLLFDDAGNGNRGQFVKAIYNLWVESKYNLNHNNNDIAINALNKFHYTNYRADWEFEQTGQFDKNAAPLLLSYESEKIYLWFRDNYEFEFDERKIAVLDEKRRNGTKIYVGYYEIFQSISLKATDANDTIIKMPVDNNGKINNCIPAFYLKYIDDLQNFSNVKETVGQAVNVLLFFTGIGELANLRYIRYFSLLKNVGTGLSVEESFLLFRAVGSITGTAQLLASATTMIYQIATAHCTIYYEGGSPPANNSPEYEKYNFCMDANEWLFAMEMVSLSADVLSRRFLKKASQRMLNSMPIDIAATIPTAERQMLNSLADIAEELNQFFDQIAEYTNVYNRISTLRITNERKAFEFAYDFRGNKEALQRFEADITLVNEWEELIDSAVEKRTITYLRNYRFVKNDPLMNHALYGDVKIEREKLANGTLGNTRVDLMGMHNPHEMVTPPPYVEGKWHFKNNEYIENSKGYRVGKVEKTMTSNDIDPQTGKRWENPNEPAARKYIKTKSNKTGVWPIHYTPQKIREEMTKAFTNKMPRISKQPNTFKFLGTASDGMPISIFKDKFGKWSIFPENSYITIHH